MARHTPGPWHVAKHVRATGARLIRDSGECPQLIAEVVESDRDYGANANAHLLAASPAMYAVLEGVVGGCVTDAGTCCYCLDPVGAHALGCPVAAASVVLASVAEEAE